MDVLLAMLDQGVMDALKHGYLRSLMMLIYVDPGCGKKLVAWLWTAIANRVGLLKHTP